MLLNRNNARRRNSYLVCWRWWRRRRSSGLSTLLPLLCSFFYFPLFAFFLCLDLSALSPLCLFLVFCLCASACLCSCSRCYFLSGSKETETWWRAGRLVAFFLRCSWPFSVAFLCGLLCFFEKKQGNNKSTLFFSSSLLPPFLVGSLLSPFIRPELVVTVAFNE